MTTMTNSHFKNWLQDWDEKIKTLEGRKSQEILTHRLQKGISRIDQFLNSTDKKAMQKHEGDREKYQALAENQSREFYKSLTAVRNDLTAMVYEIERLYEVQHRIVSENFELKTERWKQQ